MTKKKKTVGAISNRDKKIHYPIPPEQLNPLDGIVLEERAEGGNLKPEVQNSEASGLRSHPSSLAPFFRSAAHGIFLYHANCLAVLDAISRKHPDGCFDCIFADPPYFLSNGGITCHAGRMVKVDKGDWDKPRDEGGNLKLEGAERVQPSGDKRDDAQIAANRAEWVHEFNTEWLRRCQRVLKPNGTLWVTGTHHVIFSVGFALQQLGFKILNDIAWEKPNPPPNLSCRYFTHSTETILWAAKNEKSKHVFNYAAMKSVNGKQMKTVWRFLPPPPRKIHTRRIWRKNPKQKHLSKTELCGQFHRHPRAKNCWENIRRRNRLS